MSKYNQNSQSVTIFHGFPLLEEGMTPAGYAALIVQYGLSVPIPDYLYAIGTRHKKYDKARVHLAEDYGFSNMAAHAQLTREFQDAVVAFSNQRTLREIIKRASGGKTRIAKMMRRDMGLEHMTIMSQAKKVNSVKNIMLFNKCLEDML